MVQGGLSAEDRIVLDGVRQVREGDKLEGYEERKAEDVLARQKHAAQ